MATSGSWRAARASHFDVHGFTARAIARAGALVALGHDFESAYYNPANMLSRKRVHLGFGFDLVAPRLAVRQVAGDTAVRSPDTGLGFHLGLSVPLGGILADRVAFGFALQHPLTSGTSVTSRDPSVAHFTRHQDTSDRLVLAAGLAVELHPLLRLGAGLQLLAALDGRVSASLSLAEGRFNQESIDIALTPSLGPTLGLSFGPVAGLRAGVAWRHRLELDYALPVSVRIEEVGDLDVTVRGTSLYTPSQLALGLGWESAPAGTPGVSLEAGLTFEFWQGAPPVGADFALILDDSALRPPSPDAPEGEAILRHTASAVEAGARDTTTLRLGAEWRLAEAPLALRGGYAFRPTHLPRPVRASNLLDSDSHVASLGAGVTFGDPFDDAQSPVHLDVTGSLTALARRSVVKLDPPYTAYEASGLVWALTVDLRHDYD